MTLSDFVQKYLLSTVADEQTLAGLARITSPAIIDALVNHMRTARMDFKKRDMLEARQRELHAVAAPKPAVEPAAPKPNNAAFAAYADDVKAAITEAATAAADGSIPRADYLRLKGVFDGALAADWKATVYPMFRRPYDERPPSDIDYGLARYPSIDQIHTYVKRADKLAKTYPDDPDLQTIRAILARWTTIAANMLHLKTRTVTKAAEKQSKVSRLLDNSYAAELRQELERIKPAIAEQARNNYTRMFNRLLDRCGPYFKNPERFGMSSLRRMVMPVVKHSRDERGDYTYELDDAKLDRVSAQYADAAVAEWLGKILLKLGELTDPQVHRFQGDTFSISGTRDGHDVHIWQQMIVNTSPKGLLFNQFPARVKVDGKAISADEYKKLMGDDL